MTLSDVASELFLIYDALMRPNLDERTRRRRAAFSVDQLRSQLLAQIAEEQRKPPVEVRCERRALRRHRRSKSIG
jgi:hypothetical protein